MITQRYFACEGMGFEEHEMYFHVLNGFRGLQFGGHQQHGLRWLPGECVLPRVPPPTSRCAHSILTEQDHKIRVWNLNTMQKSHMLIGHEGVVRCLFIRNQTLYSGGSDCKVKVWDLKTNDCTTLFGHTSFIRAVAVDELGQTLYSGADDKKIKIWQAR